MKFEKLNQKKFEKIEKNELGMLVGGAVPGWESSGAGSRTYQGQTWSWSADYTQGTTISIINGGDISETKMLQRLEKIR